MDKGVVLKNWLDFRINVAKQAKPVTDIDFIFAHRVVDVTMFFDFTDSKKVILKYARINDEEVVEVLLCLEVHLEIDVDWGYTLLCYFNRFNQQTLANNTAFSSWVVEKLQCDPVKLADLIFDNID